MGSRLGTSLLKAIQDVDATHTALQDVNEDSRHIRIRVTKEPTYSVLLQNSPPFCLTDSPARSLAFAAESMCESHRDPSSISAA
jgi:hypothetical protein